jgi:hypothetical protein
MLGCTRARQVSGVRFKRTLLKRNAAVKSLLKPFTMPVFFMNSANFQVR